MRCKLRLVWVGLLTAGEAMCISSASAYDQQRATNNMAHDLAVCSAYYTLISEMKGLSDEIKARSSERAFQMFAASVALTNQKTTSARLEMSMKEMVDELDGKAENWSVLLNQHNEICKGIAENPELRMKHWLDKQE